jgi:chorismate mutase
MLENVRPIFPVNKRPVLMLGPCGAETREQVIATAEGLRSFEPDLFRAGIWKPRSRPGTFQGVGEQGLQWLLEVKERFGYKVSTEVANAAHVKEAIKYGVDVLWIGARTTVNPFYVQEIADALEGHDIPVIVKNPINPDLELWIGAMERLQRSGITQIAAIHRGFAFHGKSMYRNQPVWEIPIELKRRYPDLQLICDVSHIGGDPTLLLELAQKALDLNYQGLMIETRIEPARALSDARQQITPNELLITILEHLVVRSPSTSDVMFLQALEKLRNRIDQLDDEVLVLLSERMKLAETIGEFKLDKNISILQPQRWNNIILRSKALGINLGLSEDFILAIIQAIHQESINHQSKVMRSPHVKKD